MIHLNKSSCTPANAQAIREITTVHDYMYNLNDKYGMALSVSRPGDAHMLASMLLANSRTKLNVIAGQLRAVDTEKITPKNKRIEFEGLRTQLLQRIGSWMDQCGESLESDRPDDDLGISAGRTALDAKYRLESMFTLTKE